MGLFLCRIVSNQFCLGMFGIMVAVAVQSAFRLEIHQNNIFFLKKIIFEIRTLKRFKNIKK